MGALDARALATHLRQHSDSKSPRIPLAHLVSIVPTTRTLRLVDTPTLLRKCAVLVIAAAPTPSRLRQGCSSRDTTWRVC